MAGKGRRPERGVDWKKFRESPYWQKKEQQKDNNADDKAKADRKKN